MNDHASSMKFKPSAHFCAFAIFSILSSAMIVQAQNKTKTPVKSVVAKTSAVKTTSASTQVTATANQKGPRKLALLVGISQYEKGRGFDKDWWNLSCQTDVDIMRRVLIHRFGFAPADIIILTDKQATRAGITNAFRNHLIQKARPGDVAVFHYSGHGQQVPDNNGDELDGLDESLVPFDYLSQSAQDGAKSNLRDDQLGDLLAQLKGKMQGGDGKVAGNITVFLDCCFSGTATRGRPPQGRLRERGRGWNPRVDGARPHVARTRGAAPESASGVLERGAALTQGYIVLTATQSDQTAKEAEDEQGRPMGAFTYFLTKLLGQTTPGTTYRDIFERLTVDIEGAVREQSPQLEGEIDKKFLGDTALPAPRYLVVQAVQGQTVTLPVGTLQGATVGSRYALYAAGSDVRQAKNKIADAEITRVDTLSSIARVLKSESAKRPSLQAARAVETARNYGASRLKVWAGGADALVPIIQKMDVATTEGVTESNYDLQLNFKNGEYSLERKGGSQVARVAEGAQASEQLREALLGEWRWQFLSRLRNGEAGSGLKVDLRLVPVGVETDERGGVRKVTGDRTDVKVTDGNRLVLREGDYVMIELRNSSKLDAYVTVLDLSPDGSINPVFPHPDAPGIAENKIPAGGKWHRIRGLVEQPLVFRMGAPFGTEVFKVIATREPADFSPLLYQKSVVERGGDNLLNELDASLNPLGQLLLSANTGKRGASFAGVAPSNWTTSEVAFEVQPQ